MDMILHYSAHSPRFHLFGIDLASRLMEKADQIPTNWQLAISSSSTVGNIVWMFFGAITTDRFGYRKSFLFWLLILTGSIQCFRLRFQPEYRDDFRRRAALVRSLRKMPASCRAYSSEASRQRYQGYIYTWQSDFYRVKAVTAHAITMM